MEEEGLVVLILRFCYEEGGIELQDGGCRGEKAGFNGQRGGNGKKKDAP